MPRKAPDGKGVIEHRMTLGNFERDFLVKQIEIQRENALYKAGINQIGSILGSGVLLYGIAGYLGLNLFGAGYDKVTDWINDTSSSLADFLNPAGVGNYTDEQAYRVTYAFNLLDSGIVEHRELEFANSAAIQGQITKLRNGEITYDQFYAEFQRLKTEADGLDRFRLELIFARNVVTYIRNEFNYDRVDDIPSWFKSASVRDLIEACKGYPLPENSGVPPLPPLEE
jgi:hypothetical protein